MSDVMSTAVAVTGANGFVGQRLCTDFLEARRQVVAVVRRPEAAAALPSGVEIRVVPDLSDASAAAGAFRGVDDVVHLVALTHSEAGRAAEADFRRVNVEITSAIARACHEAEVRRLVYVSSIKAAGEDSQTAFAEALDPTPQDAYGRTKLAAERAVLAAATPTLDAVILRPPLVYGPGVKGNFLRLLRAVDRMAPLPLARATSQRSMVFVGNLSAAVSTALAHTGAAGEVFHIADDEQLSVVDVLRRLAVLLERPLRLVPAPLALLEVAGRLLGREGDIRRLTQPLVVSTAKAQRLLQWQAPFSMDEGLASTVEWFRSSLDPPR